MERRGHRGSCLKSTPSAEARTEAHPSRPEYLGDLATTSPEYLGYLSHKFNDFDPDGFFRTHRGRRGWSTLVHAIDARSAS